MNQNSSIHGILIKLPLPDHINTDLVLNSVSKEKDVDGFHTYNAGKFLLRFYGAKVTGL